LPRFGLETRPEHADSLASLTSVRPSLSALLAAVALAAALAGCGKSGSEVSITVGPSSVAPPSVRGVLGVVTKNTSRVGGIDAVIDAGAVARSVYPGLTAAARPQAVVLVNERDWFASLPASALASAPLRAPILFTEGNILPAASLDALEAMNPTGAGTLGGVQVIEIGSVAPLPVGYRTRLVPTSPDPATAAVSLERLLAVSHGRAPRQVIVVAAEAPEALQMPAAGLSAESGAPILFVTSAGVPTATAELLARLHQPSIYVIDSAAVGARTLAALAPLGPVTQISHDSAAGSGVTGAGTTGQGTGASGSSTRATGASAPAAEAATENAIAVARFTDGVFGWGVKEPGHGLVFASSTRPLDAPAAAPLSASGSYGPLLLLESPAPLPPALGHYLGDLQPAYSSEPQFQPVHGAYNHGWLIGGEGAIAATVQSEIDSALEIAPTKSPPEAQPEPAPEAPAE
jgi:hypothetical protein